MVLTARMFICWTLPERRVKVTAYRYSLGQLGLETVEMSTWKRSWRWNMAAPAVPRRYSTRKDMGLDTLWLNSAIWNHSDYLIKLSIFCQFQLNFIMVCFDLILSKEREENNPFGLLADLAELRYCFRVLVLNMMGSSLNHALYIQY